MGATITQFGIVNRARRTRSTNDIISFSGPFVNSFLPIYIIFTFKGILSKYENSFFAYIAAKKLSTTKGIFQRIFCPSTVSYMVIKLSVGTLATTLWIGLNTKPPF